MEQIPRKIYPERASENIGEAVERLQKVISGEIPQWEISDQERTEILAVETDLGNKLESIVQISPREISFYLNYLLTPEGVSDFETITGLDLPDAMTGYDNLKRFLYEHTEQIQAASLKDLTPLGGRSTKHGEAETANAVDELMNDRGEINPALVPANELMTIRLTPELDYERAKQLRDLKSELKGERAQLANSESGEDYQSVLDGIYELYQRKINEIIAEDATAFYSLRQKSDFLGEESLTEAEQLALTQGPSSVNLERSLARRDKFLTGASNEFDDDGWQKQVATDLIALADEQEEEFLHAILERDAGLAEKGLDKEKIFAADIAPDIVEKHCQDTLRHYGYLSEHPASEYSPDRPGSAPDNKWQVIVSDSYQSLSVNGKQKVVKCPNKPQSIERLLSVSIAHEIEGHVVQHENRSKIPLKLFENLGSDRSSIFAEAGAMRNEGHVTQSAFGYKEGIDPPYIRAMAVKLEGGNYADCMNAFYTSAIKVYQMQLDQGLISEDEFKNECKKRLAHSINRTGRLFRGGASRTNKYPHLSESKATVYSEQMKLASELQAKGLDQTLNLTDVNLDALEFLVRAKLIDLDKIRSPDFYSLELWEQEKSKYQLEQSA